MVREYFRLLDAELAGQPLVKAQVIRALIGTGPLQGRSRSSVEKKFQNISALLKRHGMRWVTGYAPLPNVQKALERQGLHHGADASALRARLYLQVGRLVEE